MFGTVGLPELLAVIGIVALAFVVVWPAARICRRLGFSRWLGVLAVIPVANLVLLWFVAVAQWPLSETARGRV
jgi:predicted PurR-regulated permease PerM